VTVPKFFARVALWWSRLTPVQRVVIVVTVVVTLLSIAAALTLLGSPRTALVVGGGGAGLYLEATRRAQAAATAQVKTVEAQAAAKRGADAAQGGLDAVKQAREQAAGASVDQTRDDANRLL
jgi:hypothetical protein